MTYRLAIDIGASSGRHILGYLNNGKLETTEVYRFSNAPKKDGNNLVWDIEHLLEEILNGLKECAKLGKIPKTVGIDTWGVDYVLLDKQGKEINPCYCYRDSRTEQFLDTAVSFSEMYSTTGIQFQPFNTVYQLLADKHNGRLEEAESFLMVPTYLSYKLTDKKMHEYTNCTTMGLVNAETRNWDFQLIEKLQLPKHLFAEIQQAGYSLGCFSEEIQQIVGFNSEVILVASHDTASAVACAKQDTVYISSGTWSLLGILGTPNLGEIAMQHNYSNEGGLFNQVRFLKNIMGLWIVQELRKEIASEFDYVEIATLAINDAIYDWQIDINDKSFLNPVSMKQAIVEMCKVQNQPVPQTKGQFFHCVYSSLAHSYKTAIAELEEITGKKYDTIHILGGGCQNRHLNQLTANICNRTVLAGPSEATAWGNLLVQMVSNGRTADQDALERVKTQTFTLKEINPKGDKNV